MDNKQNRNHLFMKWKPFPTIAGFSVQGLEKQM